MILADYLSVPFVIESESVEGSDGSWVRRVTYPDLPDCVAEAVLIEDALDSLERRRVHLTLTLLREGHRPPTPRPPLRGEAMLWALDRLGLRDEVGPLLDRDEASLRSVE